MFLIQKFECKEKKFCTILNWNQSSLFNLIANWIPCQNTLQSLLISFLIRITQLVRNCLKETRESKRRMKVEYFFIHRTTKFYENWLQREKIEKFDEN